jgi:hypothetical protein
MLQLADPLAFTYTTRAGPNSNFEFRALIVCYRLFQFYDVRVFESIYPVVRCFVLRKTNGIVAAFLF